VRSSIFMAAIAVVTFCGSRAWADAFETGNELLRDCEAKAPLNVAHCSGYLQGVIDELEAFRYANGLHFCLPAGTKTGQIIEVVVAELKEEPTIRHLSAAALVAGAITRAWCSPKRD
jgi:hypothetical protein